MKHGLPFWAIMLARVLPGAGASPDWRGDSGAGARRRRPGGPLWRRDLRGVLPGVPRAARRGDRRGYRPSRRLSSTRATARDVIAQGRDSDPDDGAAMPGYAQTAGGPLSEARLDQVIAYMATWATGTTCRRCPRRICTPTIEQVPDYFGDVQHGAESVRHVLLWLSRGGRARTRPAEFPRLRV